MSDKEAGDCAPKVESPVKVDHQLEQEIRTSLVSLIFGSAGFGFSSKIAVDRSSQDDEQEEDVLPRLTRFPDVSMLLNAIDDDEELKGLFELKKLDHELAFALRHALILFLQRLDQGGATAVGLMAETLAHFIQEHPSLKGYRRRWDDKFAENASRS